MVEPIARCNYRQKTIHLYILKKRVREKKRDKKKKIVTTGYIKVENFECSCVVNATEAEES